MNRRPDGGQVKPRSRVRRGAGPAAQILWADSCPVMLTVCPVILNSHQLEVKRGGCFSAAPHAGYCTDKPCSTVQSQALNKLLPLRGWRVLNSHALECDLQDRAGHEQIAAAPLQHARRLLRIPYSWRLLRGQSRLPSKSGEPRSTVPAAVFVQRTRTHSAWYLCVRVFTRRDCYCPNHLF